MKGNNYSDNLEVVANQKIKERNFWLEQLSGEWSKSTIPYNYGKTGKKNRPGDFADFHSMTFELAGEHFPGLMKLSNGVDIKLYFLVAAGLVALIHKYNPYTGSNDVIIGSPIYKQDTEGQFVNTVLTLRNRVREDMTFKELLLQVRQVIIEANENCNYPVETLAKQLGKPYSRENDFPLFDIVILLVNIHERTYIKHIHNNIGFFFERTNESIACVLEYNAHLYDRWAVEKIADHLRGIFRHVLFDPDVKISEVDMLTEEEKKQILEAFNDTCSEYPRDKTIHELFEEQMGCTPDRIAVVGGGHGEAYITYRELNKRSGHLAVVLKEKSVGWDTIVGIKAERSVEMIIGILGILKAGGAYLPIDPDYPGERIDYMLKDSHAALLLCGRELSDIGQVTIKQSPLERGGRKPGCVEIDRGFSLAYIIYTSGSTGKPKGVMVGHRNVIRLVKNTHYVEFKQGDRLLQTSSVEFDAATYEIWGSILNGLSLCFTPQINILTAERLGDVIRKYDIGTMWLTSPLFNQLTSVDIEIFKGLRNLLVGGDVLSPVHINKVKRRFPRLKMINGYGPTENTTFSTTFLIESEYEDRIPIGKPITNSTAYIVDKADRLVPVGAVGELWVGGDGVARGYLNNPELTVERFVCYRSYISYKTGDLTRWLPDGNIEFLGRMDYQVKIRGYRVELREIEEHLLTYDGIKEVFVIDRKEQGGDKYLCAYIVPAGDGTIDPESVRDHLSRFLPDYMIPSYVMNLDKIPLNPNGKVDRKALPEPVLTDRNQYMGPRNKLEEKLAALWRRVLGVEVNTPIGIDDNFFSLGGHSLKATALISNILKEWEIELPLERMFKYPTIRGLSEYIDRNRTARSKFLSIEPVEEKEYYPLSSAQKRIYIIRQMETESTRYNMPYRFPFAGEIDKERLEKVFIQLIRRHESLRTSFHMIDDEPVQKIHHDGAFEVKYYDLATEDTEKKRTIQNSFVRPFDLSYAPLLRVALIRLNEGMHLLLVDMHHIISDGTSQEILVRDFTALYADRVLAPLRLQYKDYSEWQNSETQQAIMKSQEKYWLREFSGELPVLNLPTDYPRPLIQSIAGRQLSFTINKEMTGMIKGLCQKTAATLYMVLLCVITVLLAKLGSQEDIIVGIPTAGRRHTDLQDIIGMFINTLSMRNYPTGEKCFIEFVEEVKERTLEAYDNQEYQFEDLVEKVSIRRDPGRNPIFDVVFNFLNQADYRNYREQAGVNPAQPELIEIIEDMGESKANFDILFQGTEIEDMIYFSINYCTALYKGETIRRFIDYFKKLLVEIKENPSRKLSSLEILSVEEINRLLFDFNDTAVEYPGEKTIHQLFEEQAEKTPQRMAAVGRGKKTGEIVQLTYGKLKQESDRLAHALKEKGVLTDSIIGIMMKRSVEMIIGILGILKAGGAYLPIDPEYPRERIEYMLKDSNAKLSVTIDNLEELDNLETSRPHNFILSSTVGSRLPITSLAYIIYTSGTTGKPKGCMIEHRNLVRLLVNDRFPFNFSLNDTWTLFHSYCFDFSVWEIWGAFVYGGRLIIVPGMIARDPHRFLELVKKEQVTVLNQTPAAFYHLIDEAVSHKKKSLPIRYIIFGGEALAPARLKEWHDNYPRTRLINMYGITETTVHVTFKEITQREIRLNEGNIGRPIPTLNTYIMDKYGKLQPMGVAGELWVGGAGVSRGYLNNVELTAEKFDRDLLDFYDSHNDNQLRPPGRRRLYRSGDLVRRLPNGEMEYLGRIDQQVKIRGFRVELGEIEACLLRNPVIKEAVVMASGQDETKALTAYITVNTTLNLEELREYMGSQLPGYMVPSYFVQLDALPLLPNGKINREALAGLKPLESTREYRPPQNDLESELLSTWEKYIKTERLSTNVNFFEAGGNSLSLVRVHSEIEKKYPGVTLMDLFAKPNIADLALFLSKKKNSAALKIEPLPLDKGYFSTERENGVLEYTLNLESLTKPKEHGNRENLDIQDILRTAFGYLLFEISNQNLIRYYVTLNDDQIISIRHNYEEIDSIKELLQVSRRQFLNPEQIYPVDDFMKIRANPGSYQVLPLYSNPLNREFENTDLHLQAKTNNGTVEIAFRFSPRMDREEMRQLPGLYAAIVEEIVNETRG